MKIAEQARAMFFPVKKGNLEFSDAVNVIKLQQAARVTKAALFALASIAVTAIVVLAEASLIAWPIFLPALVVALITGILFYRLNSQDKKYVEGLDDSIRASLAKKELHSLLCERPAKEIKPKEIEDKLKGINLLLGHKVFTEDYRKRLIDFHRTCEGSKSLSEEIKGKGANLEIAFKKEWQETGRFGLPSHKCSIDLKWEGKEIEVACTHKEIVQEEETPPA